MTFANCTRLQAHEILSALVPKLVLMHNLGNSAVEFRKIIYLDGYFKYKSRKSSVLPLTLSSTVASYMICVSVSKEAEADYMTNNLPFRVLL